MSDTITEEPETAMDRIERKLDEMLRRQEEFARAMAHLADNFGQFRQHESEAIDDHGRRLKRLEHHAFDTEPAPSPGNGAGE